MKEQARGGGGGGGGGGASSARPQGGVQDWAALGAESKDFLGEVSALFLLGVEGISEGRRCSAVGAQVVGLGSQFSFFRHVVIFVTCIRLKSSSEAAQRKSRRASVLQLAVPSPESSET